MGSDADHSIRSLNLDKIRLSQRSKTWPHTYSHTGGNIFGKFFYALTVQTPINIMDTFSETDHYLDRNLWNLK